MSDLEHMKELHEVLEKVTDENSFLEFVKALIQDRQLNSHKTLDEVGFQGEWANNSIEEFLSGAVSWAEDSKFGINKNPNIGNSKWYQFAVFLYCGKIYE